MNVRTMEAGTGAMRERRMKYSPLMRGKARSMAVMAAPATTAV